MLSGVVLEECFDFFKEFFTPAPLANIAVGDIDHVDFESVFLLGYIHEVLVVVVETFKEGACDGAFCFSTALSDASEEDVHIRGVEEDDLVGLSCLSVELLEVVIIEGKLIVGHVAESVEIFCKDLGVLDQGAVLNAGCAGAFDLGVMIDAFEKELHLEGKAPAFHIAVVGAKKAVIHDRFAKEIIVEMVSDQFGCCGFPCAYVACERDKVSWCHIF